MRKLKRPAKHEDFDTSRSQEKWTVEKFKIVFKSAQYDKCGYCEYDDITGDMDHYRPKGRIDELVDQDIEETYEREGVPWLIKNARPVYEVRSTGYPWLANSWENFVYSCEICNRSYKRCLFPVNGQRKRSNYISYPEDALILDPFGSKNPNTHLNFRKEGEIEPRNSSKYGEQTIISCGLNRETLTLKRKRVALNIHQLIQEFVNAKTKEGTRIAVKSILILGAEDAPFSGMVRNIFEEETGESWTFLEDNS